MEIKEKQVTIYQCPHCNKWFRRKGTCVNHIDLCWKNPENKTVCFACEHFNDYEYRKKRIKSRGYSL